MLFMAVELEMKNKNKSKTVPKQDFHWKDMEPNPGRDLFTIGQ